MSATTVTFEPAHRSSPPPGRLRRLVGGPAADPQWARPALFGLLALTALLYLWDLSRNGYANDFYAAAVQAGTKSWKAAFFGSFDSSNFITVDKTPASLWVDELSAKIFGFGSWSLLAPQAVEGVASVALLYAAVRRWFGPSAGLIAGAVLALTPAAALIFRFNNPDALLVLLMTAAGYAVQRALERDRTRWLVLAGLLLGFAFLTKMAQAFLVVPGFGVAYLWAGPTRLRRRIWQLLAGLGGVIVGAGWWIAIAQLTPVADRPYFGGSTDNNILELALGYNGFGRLDGSETGSIGGGGGGTSFGGATGVFRLFQSEFGGQVSWLIPAALISLGALLWISRRAPRTSRVRSFALLWGGWLLVTGVVFSYMQGIIHPYYMVALAPAIGALVGVGAISLLQSGLSVLGRAVAAIGDPGHRDLGLRAARADTSVAAVAAVDGAAGRGARRDLGLRRARGVALGGPSPGVGRRAPAGAGAGVRTDGAGDRGRTRRAARLLPRHRQQHLHRLDPERRADRGRVVRRRPGPGARRHGFWPGRRSNRRRRIHIGRVPRRLGLVPWRRWLG